MGDSYEDAARWAYSTRHVPPEVTLFASIDSRAARGMHSSIGASTECLRHSTRTTRSRCALVLQALVRPSSLPQPRPSGSSWPPGIPISGPWGGCSGHLAMPQEASKKRRLTASDANSSHRVHMTLMPIPPAQGAAELYRVHVFSVTRQVW